MKEKITYPHLNKLYESAPLFDLGKHNRWVIFSDLHLGNGSSTDDFSNNAELFQTALKGYYWKKDFRLVLNGDVEELQRYSLSQISGYWKDVYKLFDDFANQDRFFKTIGNHDMDLRKISSPSAEYPLYDALRLQHKNQNIFIFHGHQVSKKYQRNNQIIGLTLKHIANPLGIKNYSVSHSSKKQYSIEKKVHRYSRYKKVASIIGHTHRPLFETPLSKSEHLKYRIEQLCRTFMDSESEKKDEIIKSIKKTKKKLNKLHKKHKKSFEEIANSVYNSPFSLHIPCLFNSGCVIGNRGITAIEIANNEISLVHWFNDKIDKRYVHESLFSTTELKPSNTFRMPLRKESLDYIFTRMELLLSD